GFRKALHAADEVLGQRVTRLGAEDGVVHGRPVETLDAPEVAIAVGEPSAEVARQRSPERARIGPRRPPRTTRFRENEAFLAAKEAAARAELGEALERQRVGVEVDAALLAQECNAEHVRAGRGRREVAVAVDEPRAAGLLDERDRVEESRLDARGLREK